jgi:hypothetical protein
MSGFVGSIILLLLTQQVCGFAPLANVATKATERNAIPLFMNNNPGDNQTDKKKVNRVRDRVSNFAKSIVVKPITKVAQGNSVAALLTDATLTAVDMAAEEIGNIQKMRKRLSFSELLEKEALMESDTLIAMDAIALAKTTAADAFYIAETAVAETEEALRNTKIALASCKADVAKAIAIAEKSAYEANVSSQKATALATSAAYSVANSEKEEKETNKSDKETPDLSLEDVSSLQFEDIDYTMSDMAPPFIGEDQCLVPGEAVVRVEKAVENSRRIFAGIDILASVDDVWNVSSLCFSFIEIYTLNNPIGSSFNLFQVLTDYDNLQNVVPNLVVNKVLERYEADTSPIDYKIDPNQRSEEQCKALSKRMKGSKLKQVGGAKVVGINFSASVTLEVREWPQGIPDFFHYNDDNYEGVSRSERAKLESKRKLERYHFPRPFAISKLPTKDISMQSIENDDGEFRMYQGVWRMQPLPGCSPEGGSAMRLSYAVEISPRPYLPVALVEGRISQDLANNLRSIRDYVTKDELKNKKR